jgi:U-box domain
MDPETPSPTNATEDRVPTEFVCPISLSIMKDPVVSRYGQSFERSAIIQWIGKGNETDPLTRRPLSLSDLISNHQLRMRIRRWQLENHCDVTAAKDLTDDEDEDRVIGYFSLPQENDDAERSRDDPQIILEYSADAAALFEAPQRRQRRRRTNAAQPPQPRQRKGLFGRFRRALAA